MRINRSTQSAGPTHGPGHLAWCVALMAALALAGCGRPHSNSHLHAGSGEEAGHGHDDAEMGVTFDSKRGLKIPATTASFLGLQLTDVEESIITGPLEFAAQVYASGQDSPQDAGKATKSRTVLASGMVTSREVARLAEGQRVTMAWGAPGAISLEGRIVALKRGIEAANGQVEVLVSCDFPGGAGELGRFVRVRVPLGSAATVTCIPREALFRTTEGDFVYTLSGDHYMRAPVKLGVVNEDRAEVTDGLYAGDRIVVRPVMALWLAELQSLRAGKACADGH